MKKMDSVDIPRANESLTKLISINLKTEHFDILACPFRKVNKIALKPSTATKKTQKGKKKSWYNSPPLSSPFSHHLHASSSQ